uniref:Uncharacterized protein n=1 Tax=Pelusios castaneus TaxID=367368 RepID=A0A8C8RRW0_9SAUR
WTEEENALESACAPWGGWFSGWLPTWRPTSMSHLKNVEARILQCECWGAGSPLHPEISGGNQVVQPQV